MEKPVMSEAKFGELAKAIGKTLEAIADGHQGFGFLVMICNPETGHEGVAHNFEDPGVAKVILENAAKYFDGLTPKEK